MSLTYGSLFAGVGGIDQGLDAAGWECRWQVEKDATARKILRCHWPDVPIYEDVTEVHGGDLEPVDVIVGGFPCQDLSVAGDRKGMVAGTRSGLFYEMSRIVEEMRNGTDGTRLRWVIWENVPGLLSLGNTLGSVYSEWDRVGAVVQEHRVVNALYFGVPQRRRRVIGVVGFDSGAESTQAVLADAEGVCRHPEAGSEEGEDAAWPSVSGVESGGVLADTGAVQGLTQGLGTGGPDAQHAQAGWLIPTSVGTLTAGMERNKMGAPEVDANLYLPMEVPDEVGTLSPGAHPGGLNGQDAYAGQLIPMSTGTVTTAFGPKNYSNLQEVGSGSVIPHVVEGVDLYNQQLTGEVAHTLRVSTDGGLQSTPHVMSFTENRPGELYMSDVAGSLTSGGGKPGQGYPAITTDLAVRRLTPLECERLMGWPDFWTQYGLEEDGSEVLIADSNRYRACGNGVVAPVAEWVARRINAVEDVLRSNGD